MKNKHNLLKFIGLLIIIVVVIIVGRFTSFFDFINPENAKELINSFGVFAPIAFIIIYILATVFFLPGTIFSLMGGIIFGPILGTTYIVIGATIGSTIAFFASRLLGKGFIDYLLKNKKLAKLEEYDEKLENNGFLAVLFLRLIPLFPFNVLNFSLGLTKVNVRGYVLGTMLGIIPGSFILANIGANATNFNSPALYVSIAFFVLLIFLPKIYKKYKKHINKKIIK